MRIKLDKRDSARRQLVTAVRMLFEGYDVVSVYSLASNAFEIVHALAGPNAGNASEAVQRNLRPGERLLQDYINSRGRNFIKHANWDSDGTIEFSLSDADAVLWLASENYLHFYKEGPVEAQIYSAWFHAVNPGKVAPESNSYQEAVNAMFAGITAMSRAEQLAFGLHVLQKAYADEDVMQAQGTEPPLQPYA